MEKPQSRAMILREMKKNHIKVADISRSLNIRYSSAHSLINGSTLQVSRLFDISVALQYNFFREIAQMLPYKNPDYSVVQDDSELKTLKERLKLLEIENGILRQTLKDIAGR